jgi:hypothetical protein
MEGHALCSSTLQDTGLSLSKSREAVNKKNPEGHFNSKKFWVLKIIDLHQ